MGQIEPENFDMTWLTIEVRQNSTGLARAILAVTISNFLQLFDAVRHGCLQQSNSK